MNEPKPAARRRPPAPKPPPPPPPRGLWRLLALTRDQLRVLGFLFGMVAATFEIATQRVERLGYLGFYTALMGLATLWKPGKSGDE